MIEEQKEQNISLPMPPDNDNQNIAPIKNGRSKYWITMAAVLVFIIGGYFFWQNYQKKNSIPPSKVNSNLGTPQKKGENVAANTIKYLYDSKDIKRKIDLVNLLLALENYKKDKNIYPSTNGAIQKTEDKNSTIYSLVPDYIKNIPTDPKSPNFYYGYNSDGNGFSITSKLENEKDPDCLVGGKICLYKITEKNNGEELLKIVRENLDFINSVRTVATGDWITHKPGKEPSRMMDFRNTISESLLDIAGKKAYVYSYRSDNKDVKNNESVVINGRLYSKNSMAVLTAGVGSWMELKEGDQLPGIPDTPGADNTFHMPNLNKFFSTFDFIRSVSDVKKITVETIENKEYYHLILQPEHKERNKFLDEILDAKIKIYAPEQSADKLLSDDKEEEYIFEKEKVFKFNENNKQIIIPFSTLVTRPIFRVLLTSSAYDKNVYTVNVFSISGDVWVDKDTFMPFRENTSKYEVTFDYNLETKEKDFWDEASELIDNIQYLDINKDFNIKAPELAKVDDSPENNKFAEICAKVKGGYAKGQCVEVANNKKMSVYGTEVSLIPKMAEECEKMPHSVDEENDPPMNIERDQCFSGLFSRTKDASLCDKITDYLPLRNQCYRDAANIERNSAFCQKVSVDYIKKWCNGEGSNTLICRRYLKNTYGSKPTDDNKDLCIAVSERDESKCHTLLATGGGKCYVNKIDPNANFEDFINSKENLGCEICYSDIAEVKKDQSLCDKIDSGSGSVVDNPDGSFRMVYTEKNNCYNRVAAAAKDISICNKMESTPSDTGAKENKNHDGCISNAAIVNADSSICEKLSNDSAKDSCYLGIVFSLIQK